MKKRGEESMGYAHFWYRPKILDKKRYAGFAIDVKRIILAAVLRLKRGK